LLLVAVGSNRVKTNNVYGGRSISDESSLSNINEVRTTHFDLQVDIDFENNMIYGRQIIHLTTQKDGVSRVALDIRDLTIHKVSDHTGRELDFEVVTGLNDEVGQQLNIQLGEEQINGSQLILIIDYQTSDNPSAVSWLTKEQTAGKKMPYMYTQCESIHCRSIAPLQDTPAIKATYTLYTTSPAEIVVRASGNVTDEYVEGDIRHTKFEMSMPVPAYLLAFAAGNLVEKQLGERTFVITEPELIDVCAQELAPLEDAVKAAESYITPYDWGVYKVLMLPPSFPYGGMENPLLTFANSGLVSGDGSSFRLFVHELSHSWFGNLVTNENWSNFWLNEGFTVFLERKTDSILFGRDASKVAAKLGNSSLYLQIESFGLDNNYTSLHPDLNGNHPDTSISGVPYEKGFQFLTYLESLVGEDNFQDFLQSYVNTFATHSLIVEDFVDFFTQFVSNTFRKREARAILKEIDWDTWIYGTGYPPVVVDLETEEFDLAMRIAHNYINAEYDVADIEAYNKFSSDFVFKSVILMEFIASDSMTTELVARINSDLGVSQETNTGFRYLWIILGISSDYLQTPFESADQYVGSIGRNAYVTPIYTEIIKKDRDTAWTIFQKHIDFYHPIARDSVSSLFETEIDVDSPPRITQIF